MRQGVKFPAWTALACAVGIAAVVVAAYSAGPLSAADFKALTALEAPQGPVVTNVLTGIVRTADPVPLTLMLLAIAWWGYAHGRRRQAVMALAAVIGANVATLLLKVALSHPRLHPVFAHPNEVWDTAFPSGHATAAMSIALAAVIVCPPHLRARVAPAAGLYALAVGLALPIVGWHFPSDVLGGFLVAAIFAFGVVALSRQLAGPEAPAERTASIGTPPRSVLLGAAGAVALVALLRMDDLLAYARYHTAGVAVFVGLVSACGVLVGGASRLADG
jgi:membrane-associated phospholipid phosphatase